MNRYIYTTALILKDLFDVDREIVTSDKISVLFDESINEIAWILTLTRLELIYGFEIPDDLYDRTDLTLEEFAGELSRLDLIPNELYPEFYDIKTETMRLTKRAIGLGEKSDEKSIQELNDINKQFELLTDRLNILLGRAQVN